MYKIVLVDDEKGIIEGLQVFIHRYLPDCQVVGCAYDGEEGYQLGLELRPDIIITDIRMLELDGLEMIEMLQNEGVNSKFVILSGYAEFEYAKRGIHLGVKSYLNKPIEEKELQDCVNKIIREIEAERSKEIRPLNNPLLDIPKKNDVISEIKQYVTENFNKNMSLADLSNRFYINLHYLSQLFKEKTGQTYLDFLTQVRIERAKELLEKSELKLYEICHLVGYSDATHFSKVFEKWVGCKPAEFRKSRRG